MLFLPKKNVSKIVIKLFSLPEIIYAILIKEFLHVTVIT